MAGEAAKPHVGGLGGSAPQNDPEPKRGRRASAEHARLGKGAGTRRSPHGEWRDMAPA